MDFLTSLDESIQFLIQIIIVLICLFYGAKKGGIALGLLGGIGILMLVFAFHIKPGKPAIDVMLTILAVVVASATLQASGGLDVMLQIAERILRRNPKFLTILAPFVTCFLTILCGTGHVVYTIMPIIYDIAIKNGIRPERPMAAASISSQMGIIASPVSVAVVSLTALLLNAEHKLAGFDGYINLLQITIPSTLFGVLCVGIFSWFRGKDLDKDKVFQEKGLEKYIENEKKKVHKPITAGPFKNFLIKLGKIQEMYENNDDNPIKIAICTARDFVTAQRALNTIKSWGVRIGQAFFLNGTDKSVVLEAYQADIFFDDSIKNISKTSKVVPSCQVL